MNDIPFKVGDVLLFEKAFSNAIENAAARYDGDSGVQPKKPTHDKDEVLHGERTQEVDINDEPTEAFINPTLLRSAMDLENSEFEKLVLWQYLDKQERRSSKKTGEDIVMMQQINQIPQQSNQNYLPMLIYLLFMQGTENASKYEIIRELIQQQDDQQAREKNLKFLEMLKTNAEKNERLRSLQNQMREVIKKIKDHFLLQLVRKQPPGRKDDVSGDPINYNDDTIESDYDQYRDDLLLLEELCDDLFSEWDRLQKEKKQRRDETNINSSPHEGKDNSIDGQKNG